MSLTALLAAAIRRTRAFPTPARYAATIALVGWVFLLQWTASPFLPERYPFLLSFAAILLAATLFDRGSGLLATVLSAVFAAYFYLPPVHSLAVADMQDIGALVLFAALGSLMACVLEALHRALAQAERAAEDLRVAERGRALLLQEFRHRTRNDLGSLVGILLLRARAAPSEAAREGLREAAEHALALARVHTRLAEGAGSDDATVDTRDFVLGLCADLDKALAVEGLRPVALVAEAESHRLASERAVQLGLVLNEAVTNALKYAFPEGRGGTIRVRFVREGDQFVLAVSDDGPGHPGEGEVGAAPPDPPPRGSGLGTRLLRALAAQLRGSFARRPGEGGVGTLAELRFPVEVPGMPRP